jgi:hypothetical protein
VEQGDDGLPAAVVAFLTPGARNPAAEEEPSVRRIESDLARSLGTEASRLDAAEVVDHVNTRYGGERSRATGSAPRRVATLGGQILCRRAVF